MDYSLPGSSIHGIWNRQLVGSFWTAQGAQLCDDLEGWDAGAGREAQEGANQSGKLLADSRLVSQAITYLNEILTLSQAIMDKSRNISEHLLHYL